MSNKQIESDHVEPVILGDIVQLDIRKHSQMIVDIRHLLIVLHEYENEAVIINNALKMGLETYKNLLNCERDLIGPF